MKIAEHCEADVVVLQPAGAVIGPDAMSLGQRLTELAETTQQRIAVDLTMVTQVDSTGLEVLVDATERLIRTGRVLVLVSPSETFWEVLEITEVASLFEQHDRLVLASGSTE